ncbi:hypothetical protein [Chitinophaga sp. CF118]|uniref:hypothetical protein n=1 Tax=Chitinophaga sp. CF118 TaxID=1884367 RepID=UPI000B7C768B|nr:hypothetical protein [Chitinophaga sp. CF118]
MIIYGHNNYCRKKVQLHEVGIFTSESDIRHFELTQRYAHLYWIPFFPFELSWSARSRDGKLYKINPALEQRLNAIPYSWTSGLAAFAGPLLIIAGFIFFYFYNMYDSYASRVRYEARIEKEYEEKEGMIMHPATEDYYRFSGERRQYAKVIGANDKAVLLSAAVMEPRTSEVPEIMALLEDTTKNFPPVWVNKSTLKKMADNKNRFDTTLFGLGTFHLEEIKRLGEPVLTYSLMGAAGSMFDFKLKNEGELVYFTAIDKMKTDVTFGGSMPDTCIYGDDINFNVTFPDKNSYGEFAFAITCEDRKHNIYKYLITGKGFPDHSVVITKQL